MCFSPEMDLVAGAVITGVGIDALRHVSNPRQLPLASLPVLFGVHQLIETIVWWELQGQVCHAAGGIAARIYLFIALFLVPIVVPAAFLALGLGRWRTMDQLFLAAGVVSGSSGLYALLDGPVDRVIEGHHIAYSVDTPALTFMVALYVLAACGPGLAARSRKLVAFGALNLAVVALLVVLAQTALISLWCVWAAITSILLNIHIRRASRDSAFAKSGEIPSLTGS